VKQKVSLSLTVRLVCVCVCVCVCACARTQARVHMCVVLEAVCSYMPLSYMFLCSKSLNSKQRITILDILLNVHSMTKAISKIYFVDFAVCK